MNANSVPDKTPLILVADDDKSMRLLLRLALEQEGYQVAEAKNGEECITIYKKYQPDLILLDAVMPIMDGFTCCTQVRNQPRNEHTSILMITVLDDPDSVEQAFEVGATDYITKPINWSVLRHRVRRLIQQSQQMQHIASLMQFKQLICLDSLTQANPHLFYQYLNQEWRRMAREKAPLSLIVCEIDGFSNYINTNSIQAKDSCLPQVANVINRAIKRPADLGILYKKGQFVIILPQTKAEGAVYVAELIKTEVRALAIASGAARSAIADAKEAGNYVTVSCGVASTIPSHEVTAETLFTTASLALEEAKSAGGDQVIINPDS